MNVKRVANINHQKGTRVNKIISKGKLQWCFNSSTLRTKFLVFRKENVDMNTETLRVNLLCKTGLKV